MPLPVFPSDRAICIRDRSPGWGDDWSALAFLLWPVIHARANAILRQMHPASDVRERADEVTSDVLADYHEKALIGGLLAAWDPTRTPVVGFLTGSVVHHRVIDRLRSAAVSRNTQLNGHEPSIDHSDAATEDRAVTARAMVKLLTEGTLALEPLAGPPAREHLVAGIQLHGRYDTTAGAAPIIRVQLPPWLVDAVHAQGGWEIGLQRCVLKRRDELSDELDHAQAASDAISARRLAEARRLDLWYRLHLQPFEAKDLVQMCKDVTPANGYQLITRYRERLPHMIRGLSAVRAFLDEAST